MGQTDTQSSFSSGVVPSSGRVGHSQLADVCEVDEGGFLGAHPDHLWGLHDKLAFLPGHHVRVLLPHDVEDPVEQLGDRRGRQGHVGLSTPQSDRVLTCADANICPTQTSFTINESISQNTSRMRPSYLGMFF